MAVTINGTTGIVTPDLGVDGTTLVVDAANDRVGIGQSSPTKKLEVGGGAVSFSPNTAGKHTHEFTTNAANDGRYFIKSDTTTKVDIQANGVTYFNGGNFGIGTDAPGALLSLESTAANAARLRIGFDGPRYYDIYRGSTTNSGYLNFYGSQSTFVGYTFGGVDGERLRIDSSGRLLKSGQAALTSTSLNHSIQVAAASDANAIAIIGRAADDIGELSFYEADKSTKLGELQYRQDHLNLRHRVGYISFATGGTTERLRIDSAGKLLINTTTSRSFSDNSGNGPTPAIQIEATNSSAIMSIVSASTADSHRAGTINLGRHRNTTVGGTPTVVNNGDTLGAVVFSGGDGSDMLSVGAHIRGVVDGTPGNNDMPGALSFSTTPDGSSSSYQRERLRITSAGDVGIGDNAPNNNYGTNLSVHSTATDGARLKLSDGTTGKGNLDGLDIISTGGVAYFINRENADISFSTNGSEKLRITSAGNVGIGSDGSFGLYTGTNDRNLILGTGSGSNGIQLYCSTTGYGGIYFGDTNSGTARYSGYVEYKNDGNFLRFATQQVERLRIDSVGRVIVTDGSNNNSYNNKLMVLGSATNTSTGTGSYVVMGVGDTNSQQSGRGGGIAFHGNDGVNTQVTLAQIQGYKENSNSGDYAGGFRIHTRVNQGTVTERLRITGQGRLHLKSVGGSGVIADFQEGTSATDSEALISVTTGYSSGSNEGSVRFGSKRTGNGNAGHFIVSTRESGSNISSSWYNRFMIKDNSQIQFNTYRAIKHSNEGASTSMYNFRLAIDMIGSTAYTIRLRNFGNGAHHVRLMASHWSGGYQLVKESYYFTSTTTGLSEDSRVNVSSSYQGAWSVSRPANGQTGYTTDLIISKSAGSYVGSMTSMIDITTNRDLFLVSIT